MNFSLPQSYNIIADSQLFCLTLGETKAIMKILRLYKGNVNQRFIDEAVESMRDGGIIIYPTDTLYAIGCDATNSRAIEKVCRIKGVNPDKQTLSIVCADLSQASEYARIDNKAFKLLHSNLPGPFTFILPATTRLPRQFKGRKTVGVRIPDNDISTALAETLGSPILSTSVSIDPDNPEDATEAHSLALTYNGKVDLAIDGGTGSVIPSAIIDITVDAASPEILREGPKELNS